jgi:hypothetical protein
MLRSLVLPHAVSAGSVSTLELSGATAAALL